MGSREFLVQDGYFSLSSDTYGGSSGSGVFDEQQRLIGLVVRGSADYVYDSTRRCYHSRQLDNSHQGEQAIYAAPILSELCELGWTSERLCGRAGTCGDHICAIDEHARCPSDCPTCFARLAPSAACATLRSILEPRAKRCSHAGIRTPSSGSCTTSCASASLPITFQGSVAKFWTARIIGSPVSIAL